MEGGATAALRPACPAPPRLRMQPACKLAAYKTCCLQGTRHAREVATSRGLTCTGGTRGSRGALAQGGPPPGCIGPGQQGGSAPGTGTAEGAGWSGKVSRAGVALQGSSVLVDFKGSKGLERSSMPSCCRDFRRLKGQRASGPGSKRQRRPYPWSPPLPPPSAHGLPSSPGQAPRLLSAS